MDFLTSLKSALVGQIVALKQVNNANIHFVHLHEPQAKEDKLRNVYIIGIQEDCVLLKLDRFKSQNKLFTNTNGARSCCDYALVTNSGSRITIYLIEMKSSKEKIKQKQLKGGICLMAYINEVLRQFHSVTDANDIEFRFVSFYLDNESFYATTVPQTSPNTAVDQLLKLPVREGGQVAIGTLIAKSI